MAKVAAASAVSAWVSLAFGRDIATNGGLAVAVEMTKSSSATPALRASATTIPARMRAGCSAAVGTASTVSRGPDPSAQPARHRATSGPQPGARRLGRRAPRSGPRRHPRPARHHRRAAGTAHQARLDRLPRPAGYRQAYLMRSRIGEGRVGVPVCQSHCLCAVRHPDDGSPCRREPSDQYQLLRMHPRNPERIPGGAWVPVWPQER